MLPRNLKYGSKVESAPARSYKSNISPQNGTGAYNLGDTIIINIPTRQNLVLSCADSYLKFSVMSQTAVATGNALRLDSCGAHGLIQRIRVFHGSNLIQDIDQYGLLAKMLFDIQQPTDSIMGKQNILAGTRSDLVATLPNHATVTAAAVADINGAFASIDGATIACQNINSGEILRNTTGGATLITGALSTQVYTYCLNLVNILGSLCVQNYFPLFACASAPLRMELTLVSSLYQGLNQIAGVTSAGLVTNVEYVASMMELSDSAMSMVSSSLQGQPLQFVVPDFRNYQFSTSLGTSATGIAFPIPAKFSSLKAIFVTVRDKGTGALGFFPFSSVAMGIQDYTFRVGSQIMPSKAPTTNTEMFAELIKSIDSLGNINHQPSIDKLSYSMVNSVATVATNEVNGSSAISSGSFYVGLSLENYESASKDSIFAGYNSNTDDIFFLGNFGAQAGATQTRFDAFANFDSLIVFDNGTCYVKF